MSCIKPIPCKVFIKNARTGLYRSVKTESVKEAAALVNNIEANWVLYTLTKDVKHIGQASLRSPRMLSNKNLILRKTLMKALSDLK